MATGMMQVRDRSVILYPLPDPSSYSEKRRENMLSVRKDRYTGKMTQGNRKRMTKSLTLMAQATKPKWIENKVTGRVQFFHLAFLTLTVASDRYIDGAFAYEKLLSPFLKWLRDTKEVKAYVWKKELQERGQIHYHLVIPKFIYHNEIRRKWNSLQRKAGLLDVWVKEHGNYTPPSTEIKGKKSGSHKYMVKDIIGEMAKTVDILELEIREQIEKEIEAGTLDFGTVDPDHCKELEVKQRMRNRVEVEGKVWDCSDNLSRAKYYTIPVTHEHFNALERMADDLIIKADEWFSIITFKGNGPPGILSEFERRGLEIHLSEIINSNKCKQHSHVDALYAA